MIKALQSSSFFGNENRTIFMIRPYNLLLFFGHENRTIFMNIKFLKKNTYLKKLFDKNEFD
jgi:hypothetical protein